MDIAKIIYISLTMLTAWVFMDTAFPMDTYKHLLGVIGSYICVGCSALFASWFAWHWVHPFSYVKYLLCGLLTTFLFHAGLTIGSNYHFILSWSSCDKYSTYNSVGSIKLYFKHFHYVFLFCGTFYFWTMLANSEYYKDSNMEIEYK